MQEFLSISCRILPLPRLFSQPVNFDISFLSYYIYHLPKEKQPANLSRAVFLYIQLFFVETMISKFLGCLSEKVTELAEFENKSCFTFAVQPVTDKISTVFGQQTLLGCTN